MFGCLRRLGCLAILGILAALAVTRDSWLPLAARLRSRDAAVADTLATWQPLDPAAATRGEQAVRALSTRRGPVYVNLGAGELASYAFLSLSDALPPALRASQTAVLGDRIYLRTSVSPADFAGLLGPAVRGLLHQRDTLRLGATLDVVRPGLAQFRVRDVQIGTVPVPAALIPRVVARLRHGAPPAGVGDDAIGIPLPPYIGDVRIARGRVTLYKATP